MKDLSLLHIALIYLAVIRSSLLALLAMNVVTFFIYGIDKWKAKRLKWRIPEATLLGMAVFGGSIGAWLGMKTWHPEKRSASPLRSAKNYQGWVNTMHGGILSTLIDEVCGWVVTRKLQTSGYTVQLNVKFRKAVSTTEPELTIRAKVTKQVRNLVYINAEITNSKGELCNEGEAVYFLMNQEKAKEMSFIKYIADENHYKEVLSLVGKAKQTVWIGTADKGGTCDVDNIVGGYQDLYVEAAIEQFDNVWIGRFCKDCGRREYCTDPIK